MAGRVKFWVTGGIFAAVVVVQAWANANWQGIFSDQGRRMEIDRASVKKVEGGKVVAWGRILFDKAVPDNVSGSSYRVLEAQNRYDCNARTFATLKRVYRKDENTVLRAEESSSAAELPVRSGTLDDKMLKVACRPGGMTGLREDFGKTVKDANEATAELKKLNDGTLRKEIMKADLSRQLPAAAAAHDAPAPTATARRKPAAKQVAAAVETPMAHVHWSYEGAGEPANWAKLSPENRLCGSGKRQSPIDIRDPISVDQPPLAFAYKPGRFSVVDNGYTVQVSIPGNTMALLGKEYRFLQVHFHRPAEERIDGRGFEMVAHLVHQADDGRLAVVAVLLEPGKEHPLVQTFWNHLPLERNTPVASTEASADLAQLLPANRGYYAYMGSLTTPPCSEDVLWLVMKQPVEVSPTQIGIFSRLYRHNARPIQPANSRLIKASR
jgi:carbonic anhydrase